MLFRSAETTAAVARAERALAFATAEAHVQQSLAAVPALEDAVRALGVAYHAVTEPYGTGRNIVARLGPGHAHILPDMPLHRYLGAALMREQIDIERFEHPSVTDANFDLGAPVRQVNQNMMNMIERLREAHG